MIQHGKCVDCNDAVCVDSTRCRRCNGKKIGNERMDNLIPGPKRIRKKPTQKWGTIGHDRVGGRKCWRCYQNATWREIRPSGALGETEHWAYCEFHKLEMEVIRGADAKLLSRFMLPMPPIKKRKSSPLREVPPPVSEQLLPNESDQL
jgi:hypothetical protein